MTCGFILIGINGDYNIYMLPKIAVTVVSNRTKVLEQFDLTENHILEFEGSEAKVTEFRQWIYSGLNVTQSRPELSLVVWDADHLSPECQAVLLKPMEELEEKVQLILVVENENRLSPTILSRGVVENFSFKKAVTESKWSEVRKCWSSGPSACISFVDQMTKEEAPILLEEIILKLKTGLATEVNKKRLAILEMAMTALSEMKQTNINHKLSLDNFLISSWRMIKVNG